MGRNYPRGCAGIFCVGSGTWDKDASVRHLAFSSPGMLYNFSSLTPLNDRVQLIPDQSWRDRAGVNGPLMRAAFPTASIERADHWQDLITLNQTFVFERAMIVSRTGAHQRQVVHLILSTNLSCIIQSSG